MSGMQAELDAKERHVRALEAQVAALTETVATQEAQIASLGLRNEELAAAKTAVDKAGKEERREHLAQMAQVKQQVLGLEK